MKRIAVIGAGAAGCFAAIELKRLLPGAEVTVHEAGKRPMAKLALTGGGRCNISNTFADVRSLKDVYPRGDRLIQRLFHRFGPEETRAWFEKEGLPLKEEDGGRLFPARTDAKGVVRMLGRLLEARGAQVRCGSRIGDIREVDADRILVTTGGGAIGLLEPLGLEIEPLCPSLYTFRTEDASLHALQGVSVPHARLKIPGTAFCAEGALMVSDWGLTGPAALKLSSHAARHLCDRGFRSPLIIEWSAEGEASLREWAASTAAASPRKTIHATPPEGIPMRLWKHLLSKAGIQETLRWAEAGGKTVSRIVSALIADGQQITGRVRFRDEFVTCGGVSLKEVAASSLQCRKDPRVFFAGEVLDIDAVTGGFNLQAAWTTAYIAAEGIANSM